MNSRKPSIAAKTKSATARAEKPRKRSRLARMTRSALLVVGLGAAQLSAEADFVGEEIFHRNLVDRLHSSSLTRYHD